MSDNTARFANQAQEATRAMYETMQGMAETQFTLLQRLQETQRAQLNEAARAAKDQLELIAKIRNPREYAAAQANLVKDYGQRYVDSINETVDVVSHAWEEVGDRLERSMTAATDKVQQAADTAKRASEEAAGSKKATPSKKSS